MVPISDCAVTLPDADDTALAALGTIRRGGATGDLDTARREIDELKSALVSLTLKLHHAS